MEKFVIRGTRGTIAVCGQEFLKYGGFTTCFSIQTDAGWIIIDAGTGLSQVARDLAQYPSPPPISMLFTHFHMDHLIGLPCFDPLYKKNTEISILADPRRHEDWKDALFRFIGVPFWPIGLGASGATMSLQDLPVSDEALTIYGVTITWLRIPHPQQCLAFRVELPVSRCSIVIATDVEYAPHQDPSPLIEFSRNAHHLIFDAQFTPEEYPTFKGWGHSSWQTAVRVGAEANVRNLILTHHAPTRTDQEIDEIVARARRTFPQTQAARANYELDLSVGK